MAAADDASSVALLRGLRSGDVDPTFVHRIDVCSAAPADLVANLEPVPGTDLADDGYNSIWYFYCPKRYKNAQGKPSGHRQRAIAGGETCWHSESGPKPVKGLGGATVCNLSYGRKEGSSRSFNRMGWCLVEYDDKNGGGSDHALCKVYRSSSSLAKGKSKPTTQPSSSSKRKPTGDLPHARPTKMSHAQASACVDQEFYQVQQPLLTDHPMTMPEFHYADHQVKVPLLPDHQMTTPDYESLFPPEEEQFQQNTMFSMDELLGGPGFMFPAEEEQLQQNTMFTVDELLVGSSGCCGTLRAMAPPDAFFFEGLAF